MTQQVSPELIRSWVATALAALGEARAEIDALNVFPVPDGDTGTNMYLTMEAAAAGVEEADAELAKAVPPPDPRLAVETLSKAITHSALLGARGNSGVILSQILRGLLQVAPESSAGKALTLGLVRAKELAYEAVGEPTEGTMLTVIRYAAQGAQRAKSDDLTTVVTSAAESASVALAKTPTMLKVLEEAGVVDSGGRGIVVILDALAEVVTGVKKAKPLDKARVPLPNQSQSRARYTGPKYEVMYLINMADEAAPALRAELATQGDSLVFVGGEGLWNVHVHVDDPGAAIESGMRAGDPFRLKITWLADVPSEDEPQEQTAQKRGIIGVAHGPGIVDLFQESDVVPVLAAPRAAPSTGEILAAITSEVAAEVIILPSDKNVRSSAEAAAAEAKKQGLRVAVVQTDSVVESLAAIAVHDPGLRFDDDVMAMSRAAGSMHYGAVTVSSKEAITTAGRCKPGDILGVVSGDILEIGETVAGVAEATLERLMGIGGELVTIVTGVDATAQDVAAVEGRLLSEYPGVEVVIYEGGQPFWPMIFGVE